MNDLKEKAKGGLKRCIAFALEKDEDKIFEYYKECPYKENDESCENIAAVMQDALFLLQQSGPRVLPVEEAARNAYSFYHQPDSVKPVFVQFRSEKYADEGLTPPWRGGVNQRALLKRPDAYGRDFVFWTDRPTEEQMKAVEWND